MTPEPPAISERSWAHAADARQGVTCPRRRAEQDVSVSAAWQGLRILGCVLHRFLAIGQGHGAPGRGAATLALLAASVAGCASHQPPTGQSPGPVPRGDRVLSVALLESETGGFDAAVRLARSAGMQETIFSVNWDEVEPRPGDFQEGALPLVRAYFPAVDLPIHLTVATIDTNNLRLPPDLAGRAFDDPEVAARFRRLLGFVLDQLAGVRITGLSIGNEVDAWLGQDARRWAEYHAFFAATAPFGRQRGLRVGVKATLDGLTQRSVSDLMALNRLTDLVLVTYYPLLPDWGVKDPSVVRGDFDALVALYPGRRIAFLEAGYPSSALLGSSGERQQEFVRRVFEAWDAHAVQVETVCFFALTDPSPSLVDTLQDYYGLPDPRFRDYLATLGLRTWPGLGADKPALGELRAQARARGWPTGP